jgi:hypothetical protein
MMRAKSGSPNVLKSSKMDTFLTDEVSVLCMIEIGSTCHISLAVVLCLTTQKNIF